MLRYVTYLATVVDRYQRTVMIVSCVDVAAVVWSRRCWTRSVTMPTSAEKCRRNCSATGNIMKESDFQRN